MTKTVNLWDPTQ